MFIYILIKNIINLNIYNTTTIINILIIVEKIKT